MRSLLVTNDANQKRRFITEDHSLVVELKWLPFVERWYITITEGTTVWVQNRQVVALEFLVYNRGLGGDFFAPSIHGETFPPGRNAWGNTHRLVWATTREIKSIYGSGD